MKNIDLGLKASSQSEQLKNRLSYRPNVFEFYTDEDDFTKEGIKKAYSSDTTGESTRCCTYNFTSSNEVQG